MNKFATKPKKTRMADLQENRDYNSESEEFQQEENPPKLYSKTLILVFALFFSTIFGAVLLIINLRSLGKRRESLWVLIFGIVYQMLAGVMLQTLSLQPTMVIIVNVIGAALLNEYFWNKYIGRDREFEKKNWLKPGAVSILIALFFYFLLMGTA